MRTSRKPRFFVPPLISILAGAGFGTIGNMAPAAFPGAPIWVWQLAFVLSAACLLLGALWIVAWFLGAVMLPRFGLQIIRRSRNELRPDISIHDVFALVDPDFAATQGGEDHWETVGQQLLDKLSLGELTAWGRKRGSTGTLVLLDDQEWWAAARWTYMFLTGMDDSPDDVEHSQTQEAYRGVQFNQAQIEGIWPKPRPKIKWPDYAKWRAVDPIPMGQAACLWWDIEPANPLPAIAANTFADMKAFLADRRLREMGLTAENAVTMVDEYERVLKSITPASLISREELVAFTSRRAHAAKFLDPA